MTTSIRTFLGLSAVAIVLAACGTGTSAPPSGDAPPSAAPSEAPAETPAGTPEVAGTFTVADGMVVDGPGASLTEVLAGDIAQPVLVRGSLFLDTDGQVYLAESLTDAAVPEFADLRVAVANYPTDGPTWDMADADLTGLQEVNGIRFYEDTKLYGTISQ